MRIYSQLDEQRIRAQTLVREWASAKLLEPSQRARLESELRLDLKRTNGFLRAGLALFTLLIVAALFLLCTEGLHLSGRLESATIAFVLALLCIGLAELLAGHGWRPPRVGGRAIVQGHCHQQSVVGMGPDLELLAAAGVEAELLDAGCCGMAGAFGFEADHYRVAMAVAERRLLPAVRAATPDTLVLADGFSCRTQVAQATGRRPLHLGELLASALHSR